MKTSYKIWDKVVYNRNWYNKKDKEWLVYTTITMIDVYNNTAKYYSVNLEMFPEGLRNPKQEEIDLYFK